MKYRKRPVVVDAFQWTGGPDQSEDPEWITDAITSGYVWFEHQKTPQVTMVIQGRMRARKWDYIIRGIEGEIYPCDPEIFEQTYEPVSEGEDNGNIG